MRSIAPLLCWTCQASIVLMYNTGTSTQKSSVNNNLHLHPTQSVGIARSTPQHTHHNNNNSNSNSNIGDEEIDEEDVPLCMGEFVDAESGRIHHLCDLCSDNNLCRALYKRRCMCPLPGGAQRLSPSLAGAVALLMVAVYLGQALGKLAACFYWR